MKRLLIKLIVFALMAIPTIAFAQKPFDFSDDFYRRNGIDPDKIANRITADGQNAVTDTPPSPDFRDVRNLAITGGFDAFGDLIYYSVFGMVTPETFTPDKAGLEAMVIGNQFRAFIFPKKGGDQFSPAPDNRRQDNLFDTRGGYFDIDPLGLWIVVFVSYTDAATKTLFGKRELRELATRNGVDLDGTPVIRRISELEDLEAKGLIRLQERVPDASRAFPWVI